MVTYKGTREIDGGSLFVHVAKGADEMGRALAPRFDLFRHSPTGFECGYEGSGPAQLALALCADHLRRHELRAQSAAISLDVEIEPKLTIADRVAVVLHQDFKRAVVARLPRDTSWTLTDEAVGKAIDVVVAHRTKEARKAS